MTKKIIPMLIKFVVTNQSLFKKLEHLSKKGCNLFSE
jgi:hypothetical protein